MRYRVTLPTTIAVVVLVAGASLARAHEDIRPRRPPTPPPPSISQSPGVSDDSTVESPQPGTEDLEQMMATNVDAMSAMLEDMRATQLEIDVIRPSTLSVVKDQRLVDVFTLASAMELMLPPMQQALDTARNLSKRDEMFDLSDRMLALIKEMRSMMAAEKDVMASVHGMLLELDPAARQRTAEREGDHGRR